MTPSAPSSGSNDDDERDEAASAIPKKVSNSEVWTWCEREQKFTLDLSRVNLCVLWGVFEACWFLCGSDKNFWCTRRAASSPVVLFDACDQRTIIDGYTHVTLCIFYYTVVQCARDYAIYLAHIIPFQAVVC